MLKNILLIGSGGFVGSVLRYLSQQYLQRFFDTTFPIGTMTVNILGCFIIGIIYGLSERGNILTPEMRMLLAVGFCGGFTTFSSFAYESLTLLKGGGLFHLSIYLGASVAFGFVATYLGMIAVKSI